MTAVSPAATCTAINAKKSGASEGRGNPPIVVGLPLIAYTSGRFRLDPYELPDFVLSPVERFYSFYRVGQKFIHFALRFFITSKGRFFLGVFIEAAFKNDYGES